MMKKIIFVLVLLLSTTATAESKKISSKSLSGIIITIDNNNDLTIDSIETGSIADKAGLKPGDKIRGIYNTSFYPDPAFVITYIDGALTSKRSILLEISREEEQRTFWLKGAKTGFHQKKALEVYEKIKTEWYEIKEEWETFSNYLNQARLQRITAEKFQKLVLKKADSLQTLRSKMINRDSPPLRSQPIFEKEMGRIKDLACQAVFKMDNTMQEAAFYSGNSRIGEHFKKLEQEKKEISKYISAVELHLFKAKQAIDL